MLFKRPKKADDEKKNKNPSGGTKGPHIATGKSATPVRKKPPRAIKHSPDAPVKEITVRIGPEKTVKLLSPVKEKSPAKKKGTFSMEEIKKEIGELKKLLEPERKDLEKIKAKVKEINEKMQKMSTELYQKAAQEQAAQQQAQQEAAKEEKPKKGKKDDKVVDADYKVEDEKPKKGKKK